MLYLALWLGCGIGAAALYRQKGRSWLIALVAGLLLGPVALILAALTPADWSRVRRCPSCRHVNDRAAPRCQACGTALETQ